MPDPTRLRVRPSPILLVACLLALAAWLAPASATAHAELVSSDPPVDGLVLDAPDSITLTFTEEVRRSDPAPVITLLDQQGTRIGDDPLPLTETPDERTVEAQIPSLAPGTYTVSWAVSSSTDGHELSGTFAFRIGGGLPPGTATSADDLPAGWAVVTRWLTFLGAAVVAGLLLFGELVPDARSGGSPRWLRRRARIVAICALMALIATGTEQVLTWLTGDGDRSLGSVIPSMPDGWWWRPAMLGPLAVLAVVIAYPMRERLSRSVALVGSGLALLSLLGLVMTSHAAGRADGRWLAIAFNLVHQWSVALWVGGLVALVIWWRSADDTREPLHAARFSRLALILVAIAVVTGVVNTAYVYPLVERIQGDGFGFTAIQPLWDATFGKVLVAKLAVLLIPIAFAAMNRRQVAKALASVTSGMQRFGRSLSIEVAAVAMVVVGGSALALSAPPVIDTGTDLDAITLVAPTSDTPSSGSMLVHLTIAPADVGDNSLTVRLTDWNGKVPPYSQPPRLSLDFTSLDHGTVNPGADTTLTNPETLTYTTTGLDLSLNGWWQIDTLIELEDGSAQSASFYTVLPDPNTQGPGALSMPASDPDAKALLDQALRQMESWKRVRWTEDLGSGLDVLVRANLAVIEGEDGTNAQSVDLAFSGGFAPQADGTDPRPPLFDSRSSITIGDRGWLRTGSDPTWLEQPPASFEPPSAWGEIYAGATNHQLGATQEIDGRPVQVVTFYLPARSTQSEAWMAWWIDTETGNVVRVTMIGRMHYMVWTYSDIDGDFTIEPPT